MFVQNSLVYQARESITEAFLNSKEHDALVMIDSDMTFHHQAIDRLANFNVPFITAKAFKRVPPYQPCFYTKVDLDANGKPQLQVPIQYPTNSLLEIEGSGMACAFIKREVFSKIKGPYFEPMPGLGEDLTFCYKLKEAGIKMYCDTGMQFGHVGLTEFGEEHFIQFLRQKEAEGADLGAIYT
jgi:GT2 family glycosyltransferase